MLTFDQRVVSRLWERFMSGIEDSDLQRLRPEVRESWLRSRAYGLSPEKCRAPRVLEDDVLSRLQSESILVRFALRFSISRSMRFEIFPMCFCWWQMPRVEFFSL